MAPSSLLQLKVNTSRAKLRHLRQRVISNYYSIKGMESVFIKNNKTIYY